MDTHNDPHEEASSIEAGENETQNYATLSQYQEHFYNKIKEARNIIDEAIVEALQILNSDLDNPTLNTPDKHPDAFMLRANQLGLVLFKTRFFSDATRFYYNMKDVTSDYMKKTNNQRHLGAIIVNYGSSSIIQGDVDEGIVQYFEAALNDVTSYSVSLDESFAITGLLKDNFVKPVSQILLNITTTVNQSMTIYDVELLYSKLGHLHLALLAYVQMAWMHYQQSSSSQNLFSQLQLFTAIRNISALFEIEIKMLSGNMDVTLFPAMKELYKTKPWWQKFISARDSIGAKTGSGVSSDRQLQGALELTSSTADEHFLKSLLVSYAVRNYTIHQMEVRSALVRTWSLPSLAHLLNAMIVALKQ